MVKGSTIAFDFIDDSFADSGMLLRRQVRAYSSIGSGE
jgi:hypothetical protein